MFNTWAVNKSGSRSLVLTSSALDASTLILMADSSAKRDVQYEIANERGDLRIFGSATTTGMIM